MRTKLIHVIEEIRNTYEVPASTDVAAWFTDRSAAFDWEGRAVEVIVLDRHLEPPKEVVTC